MNQAKAVALLQECNLVYEDYYTDASNQIALDQVSTGSFKSVQKELKEYIGSSLGINLT